MSVYFDGESFANPTDDRPIETRVEPAGEDLDLAALYTRDLATIDTSQLSPEATRECVKVIRAGDWRGEQWVTANRLALEARERLIHSLLPIGFWLVKKFKAQDREDVIEIYNDTLMACIDSAVDSYDLNRPPASLVSYVVSVAKRALMHAHEDAKSVVRVPLDTQLQRRKLVKGKELAKRTQRRVEAVHGMDRGIEEPILGGESEDGSGPSTLLEQIPNSTPTPEELYGTEEGREYVRSLVRRALSAGKQPHAERNVKVVFLLYGLDDRDEFLSDAEVSAALGLSRNVVKGIRQQALKRLRRVAGFRDLLVLLVQPYRYAGKGRIPQVNVVDSKAARYNTSQAKLTPAQVLEIRRLRAAGVPNKELAKRFGVAPSAVSNITNGKAWKRVA